MTRVNSQITVLEVEQTWDPEGNAFLFWEIESEEVPSAGAHTVMVNTGRLTGQSAERPGTGG